MNLLLLAIAALFLVRIRAKPPAVSGASVTTHWYGPAVGDGRFQDILDTLRDKGFGVAPGSTPGLATVQMFDALVALVHDVEGEVRATIIDRKGDLKAAWSKVDPVLKTMVSES